MESMAHERDIGYIIINKKNNKYLSDISINNGDCELCFLDLPVCRGSGYDAITVNNIRDFALTVNPEKELHIIKIKEAVNDRTIKVDPICPKCLDDSNYSYMVSSEHIWSDGGWCGNCGYRSWTNKWDKELAARHAELNAEID